MCFRIQTCASTCVRKLILFTFIHALKRTVFPSFLFTLVAFNSAQVKLTRLCKRIYGRAPAATLYTAAAGVCQFALYVYRENQVARPYSEQVSNGISEGNRRV